jgi:hypothetical protein
MKAMVCLNSTSILEALSFGKKVYSYGDDIYVNKDITFHKVMDGSEFERLLDEDYAGDEGRKFISLLMSRQVSREECVTDNIPYIKSHYWNLCL